MNRPQTHTRPSFYVGWLRGMLVWDTSHCHFQCSPPYNIVIATIRKRWVKLGRAHRTRFPKVSKLQIWWKLSKTRPIYFDPGRLIRYKGRKRERSYYIHFWEYWCIMLRMALVNKLLWPYVYILHWLSRLVRVVLIPETHIILPNLKN